MRIPPRHAERSTHTSRVAPPSSKPAHTHPNGISFYIPARNAEHTLNECIDAVREQSRPPDEFFIVVDPRSTDRTVEVALASGVRVIEQEGASLGSARNTAIRAAHHRWLASCDSDVLIERDWLERLAPCRDSGAAGVGGRSLERVRHPCDAWRGLHMPHHWGRYPLRNPFMLVSEVLFDRDALFAVGGYRDDLSYYEDSDLCQRLRDAGYDLLYEPTAVGHHQRTDTLHSLLTLRWKYSEYRQRPLLDTLAGLLQKVQVNREYALTTLSRSLARGHAELSYVSLFLFFHHLQADLGSLLSRRPLLTSEQRGMLVTDLQHTLSAILQRKLPRIASTVDADLKAAGGANVATKSLIVPPAWEAYLEGIGSATASICEELAGLESLLVESALAVHDPSSRASCRFESPSRQTLEQAVVELPLTRCVDESLCRWLSQRGCTGVRALGRLLPAESALLDRSLRDPATTTHVVGLIAHLEASADPLGTIAELDGSLTRALVCYRPPSRFVAGLDVASAGDLAEAATAARWTIEHFDTLVGTTRLLLKRTETARGCSPERSLSLPAGCASKL